MRSSASLASTRCRISRSDVSWKERMRCQSMTSCAAMAASSIGRMSSGQSCRWLSIAMPPCAGSVSSTHTMGVLVDMARRSSCWQGGDLK